MAVRLRRALYVPSLPPALISGIHTDALSCCPLPAAARPARADVCAAGADVRAAGAAGAGRSASAGRPARIGPTAPRSPRSPTQDKVAEIDAGCPPCAPQPHVRARQPHHPAHASISHQLATLPYPRAACTAARPHPSRPLTCAGARNLLFAVMILPCGGAAAT